MLNMAMKHTVQPISSPPVSQYEDETSLSAELKSFLDSSATRNRNSRNLLGELIDDQLAQVGMLNEIGNPQATGREAPAQPRPIEGHHLIKGQRLESTITPSTPTEASSGACQGVPFFSISNEDRKLFTGQAEHARVVTAKQFAPRPAPTGDTTYQYQTNKRFPAARKKKTVFTNYQMELLEMTFSTSQYPSSVLRQQLSYVSGISPQTILTWFQNRRVRYRRKKDQKTSQRHSSSIPSEKPYPFVKSTSASDVSNEGKLPAISHDDLKSAYWPTHPAAQSVGVAFPSPDHMLNDGHPQMANHQQKYNHVYPTSQPWYSPLNSQRMSQSMIHHQSNQTDGQLHHMPSSADWPNKNCAVSYQQPSTEFCFTNHGHNLHPTSHSTKEQTYFEENVNTLQGCPYQYFPLRYPGASQTSIHNWDMINQHSMPSYHQQQVIPLSATLHTPSETQLLHMSYGNPNVFSPVQRPLGNQPDISDVTQGTLSPQRYLHPEDLTTLNSKPHQQICNEYSSSGENFQGYPSMDPSMDPCNIEVIQREYTRTQGCQSLHVPTTQSLFRSQTSSSTQVFISDQRQLSSDIASPAMTSTDIASPAMTECSFASHSLYIDLDVYSDVDDQ